MSDADGNSVSKKFKEFFRNMNTEQVVSSLYHHQNNRQMEEYIQFIKWTLKNALKLMLTHI